MPPLVIPPNTNENDAHFQASVFAQHYLLAYRNSIGKHAFDEVIELRKRAVLKEHLPLYEAKFGDDTAIAIFASEGFFAAVFIEAENTKVHCIDNVMHKKEFNLEWANENSMERKWRAVLTRLGVKEEKVKGAVRIPDRLEGYFPGPIGRVQADSWRFGTQQGISDANKIAGTINAIIDQHSFLSQHEQIKSEFIQLRDKTPKHSEQARGDQFERLIRTLLNLHGWHARKIEIPGEQNDFTALIHGTHVLGEVRWQKAKMGGKEIREFLYKLDPRPATIGLFISMSGFAAEAKSTILRSSHKSVVLFDKYDIEKLILGEIAPTELFDERVRESYDYLFETKRKRHK